MNSENCYQCNRSLSYLVVLVSILDVLGDELDSPQRILHVGASARRLSREVVVAAVVHVHVHAVHVAVGIVGVVGVMRMW